MRNFVVILILLVVSVGIEIPQCQLTKPVSSSGWSVTFTAQHDLMSVAAETTDAVELEEKHETNTILHIRTHRLPVVSDFFNWRIFCVKDSATRNILQIVWLAAQVNLPPPGR